jgi:hypothetical protein
MAKPVHEIRVRDLKASVWVNAAKDRTWFSVSITRRYEEHGQWRESHSFNHGDLPIVAKLAEMAFAWVCTEAEAAVRRNP